MPRTTRSSRMPAAVLAAVVLLSMTSTADMTVAAVIVGAGRPSADVAAVRGESFQDWLSRLSHAARNIRQVFTGDEGQSAPTTAWVSTFAATQAFDLPLAGRSASDSRQSPPRPAPLRHALTNLPPPLA